MTNKAFLNKTVIVTGGAQGLGAHLCERFANEGANIVIADLQIQQALTLSHEITEKYGVRCLPIVVDVTEEAAVEKMVGLAVGEFGGIDILVANAGIVIAGDTPTFDVSKWRKVIDVDLVGYFICAKQVLKVMIQQKKGVIIQINSKSGKEGSYKNSAYAAAKFGGIGLTQSLALEVAELGIRVNAVCPGNLLDSPLWVNSLYKQYSEKLGIPESDVRKLYEDKVPMKRGCTFDNVADLVLFLSSDKADYITGQAINVTGGQVMH